MTTGQTNNVWTQLKNNSSIRIDFETAFNFHWIKDISGAYGFHIKFDKPLLREEIIEKLRGITIVKGGKEDVFTDFVLWLNNNDEWPLFHTLCTDLLGMSTVCVKEIDLLHAVNARLKKWQRFLSNDNAFAMSEIRQMGLFAELLCLRDFVILNFGTRQGIISWTGPDFHKQDFALPSMLVEVKSYITSKGPFVRISSAHQLFSTTNLMLIAYGLVQNDAGSSIKELADEIRTSIINEGGDSELFDGKLAACGYISGVTTGPFLKFNNNIITAYNVNEMFPKIVPSDLPAEIVSVEYSIDLSNCNSYAVDLSSCLNSF
jgi:hypothetical protein